MRPFAVPSFDEKKENHMKSMILGISASPHKGGKVETLIQEVLSASGLSSEIVRLHDITIGPCKACNGCWTNNKCVLKDDWKTLRKKNCDFNLYQHWADVPPNPRKARP
jgi:hypothetical protein